MIKSKKPTILFFGKKGDKHCQSAVDFLRTHASPVEIFLGEWGDPFPYVDAVEFDYIISYLSRWVIPTVLLEKARKASINFHPAPPEYPGIGCNNFALYDEVDEFGVTCHHMEPKVDSGRIIQVKRFPVFAEDNVASLLERTYDFQLILFYEVISFILQDLELPECPETWNKKVFTREELNQLSKLDFDMRCEEVERRIKATNYENFKPILDFHGHIFKFEKKKG